MKQNISKLIKKDIIKFLSPMSVIVMIVLFYLLSGNFLSGANIKNILTDIGPLLLCASGVSFVILLGAIDLSIGNIMSCTCIMMSVTLPYLGVWSYAATILFGIIAGAINGWLYTMFKIPSFIATLGTMSIWQSIAYLIAPMPILVPKSEWYMLDWMRWNYGFISTSLIISVLVILLSIFILKYTATGKSIYAIGTNETAARLAGVKVTRAKMAAFILCGLFCALAGVMLTAKMRTGTPTIGNSFSLLGIAAVCLGGASLSGGKGNELGTLLGVLLVIIIQNGMTIISVNAYWQNIVFGVLVIAAISITSNRGSRNLVVK